MTLFEINQSLILNSIYPIDRVHFEKYGGIFREVTIMKDNECRVDFVCKQNKITDEGEVSFRFKFGTFDGMIESLEVYTGKKMSEWKRCFVDVGIYYGELPEWEQNPDWELFIKDFCRKEIDFPKNSEEFYCNPYWQALYSGELSYDSSESEIDNYLRSIRQNIQITKL